MTPTLRFRHLPLLSSFESNAHAPVEGSARIDISCCVRTSTNIKRKKILRGNRIHNFLTFDILLLLALSAGGGGAVAGGRLWRGVFGRFVTSRVERSGRSRRRTLACGTSLSRLNSAFVSALPPTPPSPRSYPSPRSSASNTASTSSSNDVKENNMESNSCNSNFGDPPDNSECSSLPSKKSHPKAPNLWLYHVESTTSTMDEAKRIVENKFIDANTPTDDELKSNNTPTSFLISATSQSRGRGTTQRNWKSSQRGNALFTIGIQQSSWMNGLKDINDGRMVPLTLLPLKLGSLVAFRIKDFLEGCAAKSLSSDDHNGSKKSIPSVTVKWPNDVLLHYRSEQNDKQHQSHEKVAGILIESSQDWFLIGIGINVGYAPDIPTEGVDYGRKATCLSQYCNTALAGGTAEGDLSSKGEDSNAKDEEEYWIEISKQLAKDIALDMHSWLHPSPNSPTYTLSDGNLGESILIEWKSYIDWNMELILRDTEKRERVTLNGVLEDGRVVVKEKDTGATRTLVADYFL